MEDNSISRFSRLECPRMHRVYDSAVSERTLPLTVRAVLPSPSQNKIGTQKWGFRSSMAGLRYPFHGRSRQLRYRIRPSAQGRSNWLNFLRKILSFSIPIRFIPAHSDTLIFPRTIFCNFSKILQFLPESFLSSPEPSHTQISPLQNTPP